MAAGPVFPHSLLARAVWESLRPRSDEHLREAENDMYTVSVGGAQETFDIDGSADPKEFVVALADRIQTVLMEERQELTPPCPRHPGAHPLTAAVIGEAVWTCPADQTPVRPIIEPA